MTNKQYKMIAEYFPQKETVMIWPERPDNWRNGGKPAQHLIAKVANQIAMTQPVTMLVSEKQYLNAKRKLSNKIRVVEMSSNDAFIRDYGPIFVKNYNEVKAINFKFNAWGGLIDGLYNPWDFDEQVGEKVANLFRIPVSNVDVVLEGCAIHTDGIGTGIGTRDVLLASDRNADMTEDKMNQILKEYLGITKMIWLDHGYFLDETGGDIDNILNFVEPHKVVLTWTDDKNDPVYEVCHDAERILKKSTDAQGKYFEIYHLQIPRILTLSKTENDTVDHNNGTMPRNVGQRLTATYVNYITVNDQIIMPLFDDSQDKHAMEILSDLYPTRKVVGIPAREILIGGGGLHTVSINIPKE